MWETSRLKERNSINAHMHFLQMHKQALHVYLTKITGKAFKYMFLLFVYIPVPVTNIFSLLPPGLNRRTYNKHQVRSVLSKNVCTRGRMGV